MPQSYYEPQWSHLKETSAKHQWRHYPKIDKLVSEKLWSWPLSTWVWVQSRPTCESGPVAQSLPQMQQRPLHIGQLPFKASKDAETVGCTCHARHTGLRRTESFQGLLSFSLSLWDSVCHDLWPFPIACKSISAVSESPANPHFWPRHAALLGTKAVPGREKTPAGVKYAQKTNRTLP